jgi:hypothetical protein
MALDKQKKRRYNKTGFDKDSNKSKKGEET